MAIETVVEARRLKQLGHRGGYIQDKLNITRGQYQSATYYKGWDKEVEEWVGE